MSKGKCRFAKDGRCENPCSEAIYCPTETYDKGSDYDSCDWFQPEPLIEAFLPEEVIEIAKLISNTNMVSGSSEVHIAYIHEVAKVIYNAGFRKADNVIKDTTKKAFEVLGKRLSMYSHLHKYAEEARKPSDTYFDDNEEPLEMYSVWHTPELYRASKEMDMDYEAMSELQDNIDAIAKDKLLKEIEDDVKSIARDFGVEVKI